MKILLRSAALLTVFLSAFSTSAFEWEKQDLQCALTHGLFAPPDSPEHRKYAPDRRIDVQHLILDVTPDFENRRVSGQATLTFKPIAKPLSQLELAAVKLDVDSLTASAPIREYHVTDETIQITFTDPLPAGEEARVTVVYEATPEEGLYFRTPEMGYPEGETQIWTQGETHEAPHWYPCYDYPNEKFTSEIICHVPEGMIALSNGRLISEEQDPGSNEVVFRWRQEKPHVNYLIALVAGYFEKVEDQYKDIPLAFYTSPSNIDQAMNSFRDTADMMAYFEKEIGVAYPWSKYYQVCIKDPHFGGMENTSLTTLTERTLFSDATENIRSSQGLVAHELAHQWFGDLVTCRDWSHLWLNEGFATYYAHLYDGHKNGVESMRYGLYRDAEGRILNRNDSTPIVWREYNNPGDQFSYRAYPKGSWVLHMLRSQLGEDLYRRCIQRYLERHEYGTVVTEDLNSIIQELSGRNYDQFFDQWVYHGHHPELNVSYSWDGSSRLARVSVRQTQEITDNVLLFEFPLTIRFHTGSDTVDREVTIDEQSEDFYFPLEQAPDLVRIDPEYTLLAEIDFDPPDAMLEHQLNLESDMIGRLLAVKQLGEKKTGKAIRQIQTALNEDPFYGVRIQAAQALQSIHTDEAVEALLASVQQPDARVRRRVVQSIAAYYRDDAYDAARQTLQEESNPAILSEAIEALAAYGKADVEETLKQYLKTDSYRNQLAVAAIQAMQAQQDPDYIEAIREVLTEQEMKFTTRGFVQGLEAVGHLGSYRENKEPLREFLAGYLNHPKVAVHLAAIRSLGTLGDRKAIPILEKFTRADGQSGEQSAAENAVRKLREQKPVSVEVRDLRNEVLDLQKSNRQLQKDLEELKEKFQALNSEPGSSDAEQSE